MLRRAMARLYFFVHIITKLWLLFGNYLSLQPESSKKK